MRIDFSKYYNPKLKQIEAHKCRAKYLLFGGAMGGGKSWFLCAEAIRNVMKYEGNRIVIVRKELSVLRRTILVTFFSICPPQIIKSYNQSSLTITFVNGSILTFIEANVSKDPLLNKLKGLEVGWVGIDEANEVSFDAYKILKTRLRWVLPSGEIPRYEIRLTSNPEQSWLISTFIQSTNENEVYIQSLTSDNYDEKSEYYISLVEAFKDSPIMMQKYLKGDWSMVDSINQLIPSESLINCSKMTSLGFHTSLGVDPARFGSDRTVFVLLNKGNIELIETYQNTSTNQIVTRTIELMHKYNIPPNFVGIDGVGVGTGVIDNLNSIGYPVRDLIGGAKPVDMFIQNSFKPYNLRSQMYYQLRNDILEGTLGNLTNEELKLELSAIQYEVSNERTIKVSSKDLIKKILGKSPDIADALCYANWVSKNYLFHINLPISTGK